MKTAEELNITPEEHMALHLVLGMLETDALVYVPFEDRYRVRVTNGFNMGTAGPFLDNQECGTVACIGGWVARLINQEANSYIDQYSWSNRDNNFGMYDLYWNERAVENSKGTTVAQAAKALRSFLETGHANWRTALAESPILRSDQRKLDTATQKSDTKD